ncbi:hypothetical protein J5249_01634 [Campylobacter fetus subsp. fetus]|nr:hypothetical protein J5248_01636 [Campylobacter fetus subsp. fetus]QYA65760.1 hypothetical protein J5249_01634 [Campylobacter fetus subsp. fetus]SQH30988.1 Uncharacterised protein [Campylobacter fetus subsp. fetus]
MIAVLIDLFNLFYSVFNLVVILFPFLVFGWLVSWIVFR